MVMCRKRKREMNSGEHEEKLNPLFFILLWTLFPFVREFFELKFWRLKIWSRRILAFLRKALLIHMPYSEVCLTALSHYHLPLFVDVDILLSIKYLIS